MYFQGDFLFFSSFSHLLFVILIPLLFPLFIKLYQFELIEILFSVVQSDTIVIEFVAHAVSHLATERLFRLPVAFGLPNPF